MRQASQENHIPVPLIVLEQGSLLPIAASALITLASKDSQEQGLETSTTPSLYKVILWIKEHKYFLITVYSFSLPKFLFQNL